jgi:hypothetical protein
MGIHVHVNVQEPIAAPFEKACLLIDKLPGFRTSMDKLNEEDSGNGFWAFHIIVSDSFSKDAILDFSFDWVTFCKSAVPLGGAAVAYLASKLLARKQ